MLKQYLFVEFSTQYVCMQAFVLILFNKAFDEFQLICACKLFCLHTFCQQGVWGISTDICMQAFVSILFIKTWLPRFRILFILFQSVVLYDFQKALLVMRSNFVFLPATHTMYITFVFYSYDRMSVFSTFIFIAVIVTMVTMGGDLQPGFWLIGCWLSRPATNKSISLERKRKNLLFCWERKSWTSWLLTCCSKMGWAGCWKVLKKRCKQKGKVFPQLTNSMVLAN